LILIDPSVTAPVILGASQFGGRVGFQNGCWGDSGSYFSLVQAGEDAARLPHFLAGLS
jgi:hypothetical protein